jgi:ribosomal protein L3 glutamine methyltransferase
MTLVELVVASAERLKQAGVSFGHGTGNAFDEAAWLVTWSLGLPLDALETKGRRVLSADEQTKAEALIARRIETRKPAAYLTGEAWPQNPFTIDERSIVPLALVHRRAAGRHRGDRNARRLALRPDPTCPRSLHRQRQPGGDRGDGVS